MVLLKESLHPEQRIYFSKLPNSNPPHSPSQTSTHPFLESFVNKVCLSSSFFTIFINSMLFPVQVPTIKDPNFGQPSLLASALKKCGNCCCISQQMGTPQSALTLHYNLVYRNASPLEKNTLALGLVLKSRTLVKVWRSFYKPTTTLNFEAIHPSPLSKLGPSNDKITPHGRAHHFIYAIRIFGYL